MSDPKIQKFGRCEIIDNSTPYTMSNKAAAGLREKVKDDVGCGWDKKHGPACKKLVHEINRLFSNSFFKNAVTYFAKWNFKEMSLYRDGKKVNMGNPSPAKVAEELLKCNIKKK